MPTLSEADSKRLLAGFGLPVVEGRQVADADAAVAAAAELGGPVVVKLCGPGVAHKTERGLVHVGVAGDDAVRLVAGELLGAAQPSDGLVTLLVERMVRGSRELIAGLTRDEQFGMTVMLGVGGILAEALAAVAFRLAPIEPVDAEDLIEDLGVERLLGPVRGEPALDRDALAGVLLALSRAGAAHPELRSADVNPLIVVDGRPVAVDALVEVDT
ncbi:MAG: acetate--CoA ligase family protein [Acidimicrobiales bacterium]